MRTLWHFNLPTTYHLPISSWAMALGMMAHVPGVDCPRGGNMDFILKEMWLFWPVWWLPEGQAQTLVLVLPTSELSQGRSLTICQKQLEKYTSCSSLNQRITDRASRWQAKKLRREEAGNEGGGDTWGNNGFEKFPHIMESRRNSQSWVHTQEGPQKLYAFTSGWSWGSWKSI